MPMPTQEFTAGQAICPTAMNESVCWPLAIRPTANVVFDQLAPPSLVARIIAEPPLYPPPAPGMIWGTACSPAIQHAWAVGQLMSYRPAWGVRGGRASIRQVAPASLLTATAPPSTYAGGVQPTPPGAVGSGGLATQISPPVFGLGWYRS